MILDAYGQPIRQAELKEPQTARIARHARPWIDPALVKLTPREVAQRLAAADDGDLSAQHRLFADMEDRDATIAAAMQQRALAVARLPWHIEPPPGADAKEKKAAEAAEELIRAGIDALEDVLVDLMAAVGHGFAAVEIAWQRQGDAWLPDLYPRPHEWFGVSDDRRSLALLDDSGRGQGLRPFGWVLHQPRRPKAGYVARGGLYRALVWPFVYKAYAVGDFAEFLETYGLPFVVGKYGREATEEDKTRLLSAVASLAHDARAIMPLEMQLEIHKIAGSGDGAPHLKMIAWADEAIARCVLGQTLSTEAKSTGLGSGVADLHAQVREDIRDADARQLAATLTRDLLWPIVALNFGLTDPRRGPRLVFDLSEPEDVSTWAEALPKLVSIGLPVPARWAAQKLGIPAPEGDEPVLGVGTGEPAANRMANPDGTSGSPMAALAAGMVTQNASKTPQPDALDALVDEALSDWQPLIEPAAERMQAIVDEAVRDGATAAELIERLTRALPELPAERLAGQLARAQFVARVAGVEGRDG